MDSFWARGFKSTLLSMDMDTRIYFIGLVTIAENLELIGANSCPPFCVFVIIFA